LLDGVLLDTSVIIDLDRIELGEVALRPALISAVSVAELGFGLDVDDLVERSARNERYYSVMSQFRVVPFDLAAAKQYAVLASLVRQSGRSPRPRRMDLQIAATAVANGVPLVTGNPRDFVGLDRLLEVIGVGVAVGGVGGSLPSL
jgi:predicted nucleic acid-binding protein